MRNASQVAQYALDPKEIFGPSGKAQELVVQSRASLLLPSKTAKQKKSEGFLLEVI